MTPTNSGRGEVGAARPPRSVSLVVPMFNEEKCVGRLLDVAIPALEEHVDEWEIVLVDDASRDTTLALARIRAEKEPRVRVLAQPSNRGLGGTLREGFAAARHEWILYSDCDLPWDLAETDRLFRAAEITGADLVSAYRLDRTGEGVLRSLYSFAYNGLVHALFGIVLRDVNFSCKLIRRSLLSGMTLRSEGSFFDAELLARCAARGAVVQQVGIDYFPRTRGLSTLSSPKTVLTILREMARYAPEIRAERRRLGAP
ncbi:MAG: glycosyltransferase family 2 protein [Thermoanaerobaculia bacterium]|nr:glycosyltransferase family 2 protein [Thermoanaerobaculia bacterium]